MGQVGSLEKMYQTYQDIAEFRLIYIREAHAADSSWPVPYATDKVINQHQNLDERCTTAEFLYQEKQLTIPCLVDSMDDAVNKAYAAWPDKIFVVRTDGKLAVASTMGPFGFKPGVDATESWLAEFRKTGTEPPGVELKAPPKQTGSQSSKKSGQ